MQVILDFHITPYTDPRIISIMDASDWGHIENKPSIIEITLPGTTKKVTHYFKKKHANNFNSINLGTCVDCKEHDILDDGFYTFKLIGSPDDFYKEKHHLQTANTRLTLDRLYIDVMNDTKLNSKKIERINLIEFYLAAAEANARRNNVSKAQELFTVAQDMLETMSSCSTCY